MPRVHVRAREISLQDRPSGTLQSALPGGHGRSQSDDDDDDRGVRGVWDPSTARLMDKAGAPEANVSRLRKLVGLRRLQSAVSPFGFSRARPGPTATAAAPTALVTAAAAAAAAAVAERPSKAAAAGAGRRPANVPLEPARPRTPVARQEEPEADGEGGGEEEAAVAALLRGAEMWDYSSRPEIDKR
jgi:hypothetical protein